MEHVVIWEQVPLVKPEFRLYYDDKGKVLFYSCEKPEGDYIVIDATKRGNLARFINHCCEARIFI